MHSFVPGLVEEAPANNEPGRNNVLRQVHAQASDKML